MSSRALWFTCVPLALLGWAGIVLLTGMLPVSTATLAVVLPALTLATTMTAAPLVWSISRRFRLPGLGERPVVALRIGFWFGLWITICAGLHVAGSFSWLVAVTLAVIFGLVEAFLQQPARTP
jgi:hypothetical protein